MDFFTVVFQVFCLLFRGYISLGMFLRGYFLKFIENNEMFNTNNIKIQMELQLQ